MRAHTYMLALTLIVGLSACRHSKTIEEGVKTIPTPISYPSPKDLKAVPDIARWQLIWLEGFVPDSEEYSGYPFAWHKTRLTTNKTIVKGELFWTGFTAGCNGTGRGYTYSSQQDFEDGKPRLGKDGNPKIDIRSTLKGCIESVIKNGISTDQREARSSQAERLALRYGSNFSSQTVQNGVLTWQDENGHVVAIFKYLPELAHSSNWDLATNQYATKDSNYENYWGVPKITFYGNHYGITNTCRDFSGAYALVGNTIKLSNLREKNEPRPCRQRSVHNGKIVETAMPSDENQPQMIILRGLQQAKTYKMSRPNKSFSANRIDFFDENQIQVLTLTRPKRLSSKNGQLPQHTIYKHLIHKQTLRENIRGKWKLITKPRGGSYGMPPVMELNDYEVMLFNTCRKSLFVDYQVIGNNISFGLARKKGNGTARKRSCQLGGTIHRRSGTVITALKQATTFIVEDGVLTLASGDLDILAKFERMD